MDAQGKIFLITGGRNAGKTSFCAALIHAARESGRQAAGVYSPGVFRAGEKTAILVEDVRSGERRRLAGLTGAPGVRTTTDRWFFDGEALAWGDTCLQHSTPCDLLFVDELGPLEFNRGEGWQSGLEAVGGGAYRTAFVVVRPELLDAAQARWPRARSIHITPLAMPWLVRIWAMRIRLGCY